jgi:hypothetical protein
MARPAPPLTGTLTIDNSPYGELNRYWGSYRGAAMWLQESALQRLYNVSCEVLSAAD